MPTCLPRLLLNLPAALALILATAPVPAGPILTAVPCALPLPELYERVSPAVVSITTASINPDDTAHPIERRGGSGVIVDAAGLILTNSHLVFGPRSASATRSMRSGTRSASNRP